LAFRAILSKGVPVENEIKNPNPMAAITLNITVNIKNCSAELNFSSASKFCLFELSLIAFIPFATTGTIIKNFSRTINDCSKILFVNSSLSTELSFSLHIAIKILCSLKKASYLFFNSSIINWLLSSILIFSKF